ncbi:Eco57I restriction-modification methylase domain-containing protein [Rhizobium leguminosarum]|uniref:Eco57I restriction-modification methylase domain-containing protein n=1 Tax=Rhizobium leguminosarum TaxID=384 RepID=UPI00103179EB|nr:N-6 DNA methylase [Rhizobium leguminosarum]TBH10157.1 restriction endonuclease [Rhizobium leguminosarum]
MARKTITDMSAWPSLSLEGNLIAPAMIAKIDQRQASEQTPEDYAVRKGLQIREEIATSFRVGQSHFDAFAKIAHPSAATTTRFISGLFKETFGYDDLTAASAPIALSASGRVPIVVVPPQEQIDRRSPTLSTDRSRTPAFALQDYLNDRDDALWGIVTNGAQLRLMRDNASLTRPAYIEADLAQMFANEDIASFAVLWLLIHRSRFGAVETTAIDCALERWRDAGSKEGETARDRLADQVQLALKLLGSGFLEANPDLAAKLQSGEVNLTEWFNELLRLVYRLIFLMVAEDRNLLHPDKARPEARNLYAEGYSLQSLRRQCYRAATWDKHHDRYEGVKVVFRALTQGQPALALPALGGLFAEDRLPHLETARLRNRAFLEALYRLSWLADKNGMVPVNWRAMETEELGSVYESLLELQPQLGDDGKTLVFASEAAEQKGNQRKTTGSYYTPDSLVQALLDTALDPVLDKTEAEADDPAKALLKLSVIDPACGSGHFLLAAARRIATRLARIRAEGTPSLADFRHALRDVARYCIYGVDRNPMAVELTKVALWIETVDPGLPLGFFDAQVRCGDALLGVFDLKVLEDGIPDEAYTPLIGDDKDIASIYKKINAASKVGQGGFDFGTGVNKLPESRPFAVDFSGFRELPEDTLDEIGAKAARFKELRKKQDFVRAKAACDLFIAAFLLPKTGHAPAGQSERTVPTTEEIWMALNQGKIRTAMADAPKAARDARAFHWPLEFPDIMQGGGFDIVIGNPPWERVEVQEQEIFALTHPEIATAKNASHRKRMIEALRTEEPKAYARWQDALRAAATEVNFYKESGRFPFGSPGKVNTYAVFADLAWQAVRPSGRAGLIIPNGLVVGFTYREFLGRLLSDKSLVSFYGFENEDKIFRDVHNETKFGLLTIGGTKVQVAQPWFTAHIRQPAEISDPKKRYALTVDEIRATNPNTLNLPAFRWTKDAEVTAAIHTAAPVLIEKDGNEITRNDWRLTFKTLFNMATDSGLFIDHEEIAPLIKERKGALAVLSDERQVYPLYEGKMFWHFDHRYGTYENQTEKQANKGVLPRVPDEKHNVADYRIQPRYWVDARLTTETLGEEARAPWLFSWRDVGPSERTFIGTILPPTAMGHASPYLTADIPANDALAFSAILSSLVVDYAARQKSSRMTFFIVEQLPMLKRSKLLEAPAWLAEEVREWLNKRAFELFYTNWELKSLATSIGSDLPPFRWEQSRRRTLQAEIDAAIMHLYGLEKEQAEWILDSFTVLRKYEERDYDGFLTKQLVLAAYDAMTEAKAAGIAYVSTLSPPPADPSLCHETLGSQPSADRLGIVHLEQLPNALWAWPHGVSERDRARAQLRAVVGILPEPSDVRRVRLAALACLHPRLLDGFLSDADRREWQRLMAHPTGLHQLVPPTNAAWGAAFSELVSSAVLDVSTDGTRWGAGKKLDRSTLNANDPAISRALFAWSRLEGINLDLELAQVPAVILPFIREGRLAA